MHGCCEQIDIVQHFENITIDKHGFCVKIVYCKSCGSVKTTTSVRHIKDDNKTKH